MINHSNEYIKSKLIGKKIAVLGYGVSNKALVKFLKKYDLDISIFDKNESNEKFDSKINYFCGEKYLDKLLGFDYIFRSPGIRPDIVEIKNEVDNGAILFSEMELFFDLCRGKVIGVTGSDGKTTTTTLVNEILREHGINTFLGGNIGTPLIDKVHEITKEDYVIVELSSFQLMTMKKSPDIAIITNITPNHLDYHYSMEEYIQAKMNIFLNQKNDSIFNQKVIINLDNKILKGVYNKIKSEVIPFSINNAIDNGVILEGNKIIYKNNGVSREILDSHHILLKGRHNVENYMAAISAIIDIVSEDKIKKIAREFKGVKHRLEFIRERNGVMFYNDSIATSPSRTMAALKAFNKKIILIAGGKDKKVEYDDMAREIYKRVSSVILLGQTSEIIKNSIDKVKNEFSNVVPVYQFNNIDEAVKKSIDISKSGDIVVFSPASSSYDMFKNFEERGDLFKEIVLHS